MNDRTVPWWRRWRRRFYWLVALKLIWLAAVLPLGWGRALGRTLARLAARCGKRHTRLARRQLRLAFPAVTTVEIDALLDRSVAALGHNLFDGLAASRLLHRPGAVVAEAGSDGETPLAALARLAALDRGVLVLTGHLGCWELLGVWLAREVDGRGLGQLGVVTGTIHNPAVDRLVQNRRRRAGMVVLPRQEGPRPLLRHLRGGGVVAVLQDQNTGADSLDIPFCGRPAPTPTGLARIALRLGVPVLPLAIAWDPATGQHRVRHLAPLLPAPSGQRADDDAVRAFLTTANARLEEFLRRNPAEWVWFHPRWSHDGARASFDRR